MRVCRVVGNLVASQKHPAFDGHKIMLCQPLDEDQNPVGNTLQVAVDHVQAGEGDLVLVMQEGNGARQILGTLDGKLPIRSVIVGIIDEVVVQSTDSA